MKVWILEADEAEGECESTYAEATKVVAVFRKAPTQKQVKAALVAEHTVPDEELPCISAGRKSAGVTFHDETYLNYSVKQHKVI